MAGARQVVLLSEEGEQFVVDVEVAMMSTTLKNLLEEVGEDESLASQAIPLRNVHGDVLRSVLEFCEHHKDDPVLPVDVSEHDFKKLDGEGDDEELSEWDASFCDVELSRLFALILAANYLDIRPLLEVTCKKVARIIESKSTTELRDLFSIENDYSPEEEAQVRKELSWCEEM